MVTATSFVKLPTAAAAATTVTVTDAPTLSVPRLHVADELVDAQLPWLVATEVIVPSVPSVSVSVVAVALVGPLLEITMV